MSGTITTAEEVEALASIELDDEWQPDHKPRPTRARAWEPDLNPSQKLIFDDPSQFS